MWVKLGHFGPIQGANWVAWEVGGACRQGYAPNATPLAAKRPMLQRALLRTSGSGSWAELLARAGPMRGSSSLATPSSRCTPASPKMAAAQERCATLPLCDVIEGAGSQRPIDTPHPPRNLHSPAPSPGSPTGLAGLGGRRHSRLRPLAKPRPPLPAPPQPVPSVLLRLPPDWTKAERSGRD